MVIMFLGFDWKPKRLILGLFEAFETTRHALIERTNLNQNIPTMFNFMENDMVVTLELSMLPSNTKKEVCDVLNGFLFYS